MNILVTGGAGFIGSHFLRYQLSHYPADRVVNLDCLTYAGNLANVADLASNPRYHFIQGDIRDAATVSEALATHQIDVVVNFAAESHVDRSIEDPAPFVSTNVVGVQVLLDACRRAQVRLVQVSTDEVYGSIVAGRVDEEAPLQPSSPYAATKASADLLAMAAHHTFGQDVVITRSANNYGPNQHPEKLVPMIITNDYQQRPLTIQGAGDDIRDWLYVVDNCQAIDLVMRKGVAGEVYNIGGFERRTVLEVVASLQALLGFPASQVVHVAERLGHDHHYAVDDTKLRRALGWRPSTSLAAGLTQTVRAF
ncbi:dTDP-glucose 4,6-dehydratase [Limosilactobacillus fermentum]|uniref:dTDP-glucose 4,6-dehydratase n=1 Tax=Limosilactobacillus fermentum TaxID=1613 RepID=UPI000B4CD744|nr:dTDP-glucose 4,6-dehydratase [Limosilactobacillus fermentum]OWP35344.1 dTDP-glucose 4,6-dehydratase [Limosilactobacillus fermentum]UTF47114.1 dTDP-glucose 4,6-dehydratase [Limosilactobacillus fermentum]